MQAGIVIGDVGPGCSIVGICMKCGALVAHFIQVVFNVRPEQRHEQADDNQSSQNFKKCKTFIVVFLHSRSLRYYQRPPG
ncbi:Uncharacterised protein [Shigella sonnei]|nr:Uncharacterised protein [Shigella sonnei]CTU07961.1 Uncharacterised protein [Escherichia coli]CSH20468.1 Uncharacterised protein [Shigella sonnei]CSH23751.1 Uncharacterised protein [Shigella sonnei]CSH76000.1 Uncharacterised protein [Shigella sonnei]